MKFTIIELQKFGARRVADIAKRPLLNGLVLTHELACTPADYAGNDAGHAAEDLDRVWYEFSRMTVEDLKKPRPVKYSCDELGFFLAVPLSGEVFIRVSDIATISGHTPPKLHDYIRPDQFVTLSLFGSGNAAYEFVNWEAVSPFCMSTPRGRLLIAWVEQVVLWDLLGRFGTTTAIRAKFLHAMIPRDLVFPAWKKMFLQRFSEACSEEEPADSKDFDISLAHAKTFALENCNLGGLLAYVLIRESEAPCGHGVGESIEERLPVCLRLRPDSQGHIDARILHLFLKVKQSYETWMIRMIEMLPLVRGVDFITEPAPDAGQDDVAIPLGATGKVHLTLVATARIGLVAPTARGQLIREYFSLCEQSAPSQPLSDPGATPDQASTH